MEPLHTSYDVVVIGGGHAGIEASAASARLGCRTLLVTMDVGSLGRLSCNPAIGGMAKGQVVSEVDALGGLMGRIADRAGIQFKMLGRSKGPAMWSPRAQMDKDLYPEVATAMLREIDNLDIVEGEVNSVEVRDGRVAGIVVGGKSLRARSVVICAGTFLCGKTYVGRDQGVGGRVDEPASATLSGSLADIGFEVGRLKTGTPPRIAADSIDYQGLQVDSGDAVPVPFSWSTSSVTNSICCHVTRTTTATHEILREGFSDSPMFTGSIRGQGPRYCPSIEDKIHRFADKDSHNLFLEPEGLSTDSVYVNGFSTSLPKEIQARAIRSVPGLARARILRYGYAVEYDFFPPHQLRRTLESRRVGGLYFAGQVNGTSGYEEAAGQGLVAGANAALSIMERDPLLLERSDSYIGVMIDDLATLGIDEPYRLFTSRAEYRLLLRRDNADLRLTERGFGLGLVSEEQYRAVIAKRCAIQVAEAALRSTNLHPSSIGEPGADRQSAWELLRRPSVQLGAVADALRCDGLFPAELDNPWVAEQIGISARYEGYLTRQLEEIERLRRHEHLEIPASLDFHAIKSLSSEAREKLSRIRPETLGRAGRINGVTQADLAVLRLYLR